jgi:hypothetical protein
MVRHNANRARHFVSRSIVTVLPVIGLAAFAQASYALPPGHNAQPWNTALWEPGDGIGLGDKALDPKRIEWSVFPEISYTSDDGFFFGAMGVVADYDPRYYPYQWRFEGQSSVSVRPDENGDPEFPTHDHYAEFDLPDIVKGIRMRFRAGYQQELRRYRGFGNASQPVSEKVPAAIGQYRYSSPSFQWHTRTTLLKRLFVTTTFQYQYVWLEVFRGSRLRDDAEGKNGPENAGLIHGLNKHHLIVGGVGIEYDSRNHETHPTGGTYNSVMLSGGVEGNGAFGFGALALRSRFYVSLYEKWLVLALRFDSDLFFGKPPVYALPVLGGERILRGVPDGFYHGLIRVSGSTELRSMFWSFNIWTHRFQLGAAAFFDYGRVFSGYSEIQSLDGRGVGIRFGTGGGLRLSWGESLMFRFDAAWSPEALGFYATLGQAF